MTAAIASPGQAMRQIRSVGDDLPSRSPPRRTQIQQFWLPAASSASTGGGSYTYLPAVARATQAHKRRASPLRTDRVLEAGSASLPGPAAVAAAAATAAVMGSAVGFNERRDSRSPIGMKFSGGAVAGLNGCLPVELPSSCSRHAEHDISMKVSHRPVTATRDDCSPPPPPRIHLTGAGSRLAERGTLESRSTPTRRCPEVVSAQAQHPATAPTVGPCVPASSYVEVELVPAVDKDGPGPRPSLRMLVRATSCMKQVREALARKLGVEATFVNLVVGVRQGDSARFIAHDDNEPLGDRRVLRVLGVDLPVPSEGDADLSDRPTAVSRALFAGSANGASAQSVATMSSATSIRFLSTGDISAARDLGAQVRVQSPLPPHGRRLDGAVKSKPSSASLRTRSAHVVRERSAGGSRDTSPDVVAPSSPHRCHRLVRAALPLRKRPLPEPTKASSAGPPKATCRNFGVAEEIKSGFLGGGCVSEATAATAASAVGACSTAKSSSSTAGRSKPVLPMTPQAATTHLPVSQATPAVVTARPRTKTVPQLDTESLNLGEGYSTSGSVQPKVLLNPGRPTIELPLDGGATPHATPTSTAVDVSARRDALQIERPAALPQPQMLGYVCPTCGKTGLPDLAAAAGHCFKASASTAASPVAAERPWPSCTPPVAGGASSVVLPEGVASSNGWTARAAADSGATSASRPSPQPQAPRHGHLLTAATPTPPAMPEGVSTPVAMSSPNGSQSQTVSRQSSGSRGNVQAVRLRRVMTNAAAATTTPGLRCDPPPPPLLPVSAAEPGGDGNSEELSQAVRATHGAIAERSPRSIVPQGEANELFLPPLAPVHQAPAPVSIAVPPEPMLQVSTQGAAAAPPTAMAGSAAPTKETVVTESVLVGNPIAFSETGRPVIVRQTDDESGQARTIVQSEDGSRKVFGANTVQSLMSSKKQDATRWVGSLTDRQIHGLVHEFGQRLIDTSRRYTKHRLELEGLAKQADFAYFGLSAGATEKDLSVAYRKMAKRMHPDKNGGTEDAKRRFQVMKEKYENLRDHYQSAASKNEDDREPAREKEEEEQAPAEDGSPVVAEEEHLSEAGADEAGEDGEGCTDEPEQGESTKRREAYDEDEDAPSPCQRKSSSEADKRIEYDPCCRSSMDSVVWKMQGQMQRLEESIGTIQAELRRVRGK
mmetsp:Transcript_82462/g.163675  ORF Transcript_82462/g.163675 Transcript_82462/m.163675 type:complete len:1171 (+) Transcript_82462:65-3577(+)